MEVEVEVVLAVRLTLPPGSLAAQIDAAVERLAVDARTELPGIAGLSVEKHRVVNILQLLMDRHAS